MENLAKNDENTKENLTYLNENKILDLKPTHLQLT
jgi:hypothetical protein